MRLNPESEDTTERIVASAEQLFAERGFEDVSLREINRAAGTNAAAIHYHFGSKDGLLRAVLDRIIEPITRARLDALDHALVESGGQPLEARTILTAFIGPDIEAVRRLREHNPAIAGFLARTYATPNPFVAGLMRQQFASCATRFFPELARALPHLTEQEIQARMRLVIGVLIGLFAAAGSNEPDAADSETTLARVVDFATAGLSAPSRPMVSPK